MKKNNIIFSLAIVLVIALGVFLNGAINKEKNDILEQKAKEAEIAMIKDLLPNIEVDTVEAVEQEFLDKDGSKIIKRYNALNGEELVGVVYIGETKGWKDGLQVAFGINAKTDKITASEIVAYNETEAFYQALTSSDFFDQFNDKDMSKYLMTIDLITGPTPNSGNNGIVAPATSGGIEKIMLLVREQYSVDTDFEMPSGIVFVSKELDYTNINQFKYVLKLADTSINVVVNKDYEIVSIDDETQREAALEVINLNKMNDYIVSETIEGTTVTLVIKAVAYENSTSTSTVVITDGTISSVDVVFSVEQTYRSDYNDAYWKGPDANKTTSGMSDEIKNDVTISPITGATYTVNAYRHTQNIVRGYMEANFEMPSGIVFVSKELDYTNINQFKYVLKLADTSINVVVNKDYEIVSIDDETQREAALEVINLNKMNDYIVSETIEGTTVTLVIKAVAYNNSTSTATVVITDGVISSVDVVFSVEQTYRNDYNDAYWEGPDSSKTTSGMSDEIKNDVTISPITGATYTVNAYRHTQNIVRGYMEANNE